MCSDDATRLIEWHLTGRDDQATTRRADRMAVTNAWSRVRGVLKVPVLRHDHSYLAHSKHARPGVRRTPRWGLTINALFAVHCAPYTTKR